MALVLLLMPLLTWSNSSLTSELPLPILFPLYPILREELYLCPKCMNCFSRFMTVWTMLCPNELGTQLVFYHMCLILLPGSIMESGLHSSLFFTDSRIWFLLVRLVCMAISAGLWHRCINSIPWACLSLFHLRGVAK